VKLTAVLFFIFLSLQSSGQNFIELNEQFIALFQKGEYTQAIPVGEKAITQAKKEFGEKHLNYAVASYNLAEAYYALQQLAEALPYYKIAIKTYTLFEKTNGIDLAQCNNSVGTIFLASSYTILLRRIMKRL
jgi:tetratricopeptide (TPR) repeat protein